MSLINFKPGNAAVTITKLWTDFKAVVAEKSLLMQYEEDSNLYYIYTLDGEIDYLCYIYKGSVPAGSSVYNQTQNDLDKTDWVNNYKDTAGQKQFDVLHNSTIKAASTAAAATDPALVVAISPNNTVAATQSGTWNIGSITTLPSLPTGSNTIGTVNIATSQSIAATQSGTWKDEIWDGTNTATVKAASTAAVASDTALVVAISPNNTPPVKIDNGAAQGMLIPGTISSNYNIATNCQAKFTNPSKAYSSTYTACLISPGGGNVNWTYADGGTDTVTMIAGYPYCVKVTQINSSGTVVTDLQVFI